MALSTREKYIAMTVGAAVALFGLDRLVIDPFFEHGAEITSKRQDVEANLAKANATFNRRIALRHVWSDMRTVGGLVSDSNEAQNKMIETMQAWAQESGVKMTLLSPKHVSQPAMDRKSDKPETKFDQTALDATGSGSMAALTRLLWKLESAPKLLKVTDIHIKPNKEGTDDLQIQLSVSTVSLIPETPADNATDNSRPVAAAGTGVRS